MSDKLYKAVIILSVAIVLAAVIETLPYWHCTQIHVFHGAACSGSR